MFESLVSPKKALEHPAVVFSLGLLFTLIAFGAGYFALREEVSLLMLFFVTLLTIPLLMGVLNRAETKDRKEKSFWQTHKKVIEVYVFLFFGIFTGYLLLGFFLPDNLYVQVFSFQDSYVLSSKGLSLELLDDFFSNLPPINIEQALAIMSKNFFVALLAFGLSFLYGASSMFLVTLNGSVFATFLIYLIRLIGSSTQNMLKITGFFMLHLIPEVAGFLIAAIAGGILSQAASNKSHKKMMVRDALKLFSISIACIILAAFIEVFVTTRLFHSLI